MTINGTHILLSAILLALVYLLVRGENSAPAGQPAQPRHRSSAWIGVAVIITAVVLFIFREKLSGPNLMLWIYFLAGTVILAVLGFSGLLIRGLGTVRPLWLVPTVFTVYLVGAVALYLLAGAEVLGRVNGRSPARLIAEQDVADQTYGAECFAAGEFEAARDHWKKMIDQELHKARRDQNPLILGGYKQQLAKAEAKLNPTGAKGRKTYHVVLGDNNGRQVYLQAGEGEPLNSTQIKALNAQPDSVIKIIIKEVQHDTLRIPAPVVVAPSSLLKSDVVEPSPLNCSPPDDTLSTEDQWESAMSETSKPFPSSR